jgi:hypothetical protein
MGPMFFENLEKTMVVEPNYDVCKPKLSSLSRVLIDERRATELNTQTSKVWMKLYSTSFVSTSKTFGPIL